MNDRQRESATFIRTSWFAGMGTVRGTGTCSGATVTRAEVITV